MGERRQPSRVSSTLAAAEVLNGKLPQRLPTSPSSRSHHSTENPSYFRPLPYRVAMAPTGLRFLAGNQNQVDLETYKKSSAESSSGTSYMGSPLGREDLGKREPGTQQPILGNLEHFLGIPNLVVILELWPEIKRRGCWPWLMLSLLMKSYHCLE